MIPFALHLANLRFASGGVRSARITEQLFALEVEEEDSIVFYFHVIYALISLKS